MSRGVGAPAGLVPRGCSPPAHSKDALSHAGTPRCPTDPAGEGWSSSSRPGHGKPRSGSAGVTYSSKAAVGMLCSASLAQGPSSAAGACRGTAVPCTGCRCLGVLRCRRGLVPGSAGAGCLQHPTQSSHCAKPALAVPGPGVPSIPGQGAQLCHGGCSKRVGGTVPCRGTASGPGGHRDVLEGRMLVHPVPCLLPIPIPAVCLAAPRWRQPMRAN